MIRKHYIRRSTLIERELEHVLGRQALRVALELKKEAAEIPRIARALIRPGALVESAQGSLAQSAAYIRELADKLLRLTDSAAFARELALYRESKVHHWTPRPARRKKSKRIDADFVKRRA